MARRACSSRFAPLWGVVLALAALFLPRAAAAASAPGLCDERGLSAVAPLPVLPLGDEAIEAGGPAPQLCEVDATAGCGVERGREGPPSFLAFADTEPALGSSGLATLSPPHERAAWPDPPEALAPPGVRRRIEHPPRG
ncbi:MAG TPA: hypothetical protein VFS43_46285 [Polyangiaceae bacterium]|nr:hypothetical protein [Polyangiaceae bacterium]